MLNRYSGKIFRNSIIFYTVGRVLNALAGFSILIWIARRLPEPQYVSYIAAYAMLEMGLVLSGFGLEWVAAIYLPQVRQRASGLALQRFVQQAALVQSVLLLLGSATLFVAAPALAGWLGLGGSVAVVRAYAVVMCVEGISRVFRDQLLSCLMMQSAAQASQLARNLCMLAFVFFALDYEAWRSAQALAVGELVSSTLSLLMAAAYLWRRLRQSRHDPAAEPEWRHPGWRRMLAMGRNAWLSNLASLSWGAQAVILLATKVIGVEATAPLGFARNLAEQVRKYMPMEFLFGIIRTLLVVRYAADGSVSNLGRRVSLMYKANLLFLLPLLVVVAVRGRQVCELLSAGRYGSAHWLLLGWLLVFVMLAHRRLTDLMAHTLGRSEATTWASAVLLLVPVGLLAVFPSRQWALVFALLTVAEFSYTWMVMRRLRTAHWHYVPDWEGLAKFGLAALVAGAGVWLLPAGGGTPLLLLAVVLSCGLMWALLWVLRVVAPEEMVLLPELLRKRLVARHHVPDAA